MLKCYESAISNALYSFISKGLLRDTNEFDILDQRSYLLCYLTNSALGLLVMLLLLLCKEFCGIDQGGGGSMYVYEVSPCHRPTLYHTHYCIIPGSTSHVVCEWCSLRPTIPDHIFTLLPRTLVQRNVVQRGSIKPVMMVYGQPTPPTQKGDYINI